MIIIIHNIKCGFSFFSSLFNHSVKARNHIINAANALIRPIKAKTSSRIPFIQEPLPNSDNVILYRFLALDQRMQQLYVLILDSNLFPEEIYLSASILTDRRQLCLVFCG